MQIKKLESKEKGGNPELKKNNKDKLRMNKTILCFFND